MRVISGNDKRAFPRQKTPEAFIRPTLLVDGRRYHAQCTDLSFGGARFELNSKIPLINGSPVQFTLQDTSFDGVLSWNQLDTRSTKLGIKLDLPKISNAFASDDPDWDLIEEKETLESIFQGLAFKGPEAPLTIKQVSGHAMVLVDRYVPGEYFEAEIFEATHGQLSEGSFCGEFSIFQTFNSFQSQILELDTRNRIRFSIPNSLARILRRETVRVRKDNPFEMPQVVFEEMKDIFGPIRLWDFSEQGFSFLDRDKKFSFPKGYKCGFINISLPFGETVKGCAQITSYRWIENKSAYLVGFHFQPDENSRTIWHNALLENRYPSLSLEYKSQDHGEIWKLFHRSGYLHFKELELFSDVLDVTRDVWLKLKDAGTSHSKRALIRRDDKIVGHLQMDRIYPKTWCVHHLAIDPTMSKVVGKELYSLTTDVLTAEGAKYVISLTMASKPWNQRNYYDFVKRYRFPEHNELKTFQIFEANLKKEMKLSSMDGVLLRRAEKWDLKRILRYCELYLSPLERDACGLVDGELDFNNLNQEVSAHGLFRKREFIVAYYDDEFVGFARMESGSTGVNIFGLLDILYIHLAPSIKGNKRNGIHESLLKAALQYYQESNIFEVVVALDGDRKEHYQDAGLDFVFDGIRWIADTAACKSYHAYTQFLYGELLMRRDQIRAGAKRPKVNTLE